MYPLHCAINDVLKQFFSVILRYVHKVFYFVSFLLTYVRPLLLCQTSILGPCLVGVS